MSPRWYVQVRGRVLDLSEPELVERLHKAKLTGLESARPHDRAEWAPLHEEPVFARAVPAGRDPRRMALRRQVQGFATHAVIFAAVTAILWVGAGRLPVCSMYWAIPVLFHLVRTIPAALELSRGAPTLEPPQPALDAVDQSPFLRAVDEALASLAPAAEAVGVDVAAVRAQASALDRAATELATLSGPEVASALEAEEALARAARASAMDARSAEALDAQLDALAERRRAVQAAQAAAARAAALRDALHHQVETLRLTAARRHLDEGEASAAAAALAEVAEAAGEVEDALVRARRARAASGQSS